MKVEGENLIQQSLRKVVQYLQVNEIVLDETGLPSSKAVAVMV